ncbi:6-pyruvoyl-tetrahydropterin synthase-related protein [Agrilactobacillus fermenti]|uniref:6-pyruvoyl-tetrahydropterin synthase-related protein n=1 Tax=Agrilactobacillus fermenti TaxID=2586909 RepID=UPI001E330A28|nr:6-pyruvoyl-tetrahydropterin synthase-related protein [Agrilactobacillus fermenti]MCD2255934.1 hypothetical protein [Agrilactobacillus fermenti]
MTETKKTNTNRTYVATLLLGLLFIFLSWLSVWPGLKTGQLYSYGDLQFHAQRIAEVAQNLKHGNLVPFINTYTFSNVGVPVNAMYPGLPVYLSAILQLILHNPVTALYLTLAIQTFLTLTLGYFAIARFSGSRRQALIFAVAYAFSITRITVMYGSFVFGESWAITFLPLVFLGTYEVLRRDAQHWYSLAIGLTLIFLCHVLSFIFVGILVLLCSLANALKFYREKKRLFSLGKAGVLTVLLTACYWLPALKFGTRVTMQKPFTFQLNQFSASLHDLVTQSLHVQLTSFNIGLIGLIAVVLGLVFIVKLPLTYRVTYIIGLVLLMLGTKLVPWQDWQNSQVAIIQFPYRFLIFAMFFLMIVLAYVIDLVLKKLPSWTLVLPLVLLILPATIGFNNWVKSAQTLPELNYLSTAIRPVPRTNGGVTFKVNQANYHNMLGYHDMVDYWPAATVPNANMIKMHLGMINGELKTFNHITSQPNGMTYHFSAPKQALVDLPFLIYGHNYQVRLNGHQVPYQVADDHTLVLTTAKNQNVVTVRYIPTLLTYLAFGLTLIGLVILGFEIVQRRKLNQNEA